MLASLFYKKPESKTHTASSVHGCCLLELFLASTFWEMTYYIISALHLVCGLSVMALLRICLRHSTFNISWSKLSIFLFASDICGVTTSFCKIPNFLPIVYISRRTSLNVHSFCFCFKLVQKLHWNIWWYYWRSPSFFLLVYKHNRQSFTS